MIWVRSQQISLAALLAALLAACANTPAPVIEAGEPQVNNPPVIVSGPIPEGGRTPASPSPVPGNSTISSNTGNTGSNPNTENRSNTVTSATAGDNSTSSGNAGLPASHQVRRGETLYSIAYQYDLDYRSLARANNLPPPYTIFVGQELNLDVTRVRDTSDRSAVATLGTPVTNNSVARSRPVGSDSGGVVRQPIDTRQPDPVWRWPVNGRVIRGFSETGGEGLDISGEAGDPVYAAGAGDVVYAGNGIQGAGNLIILRHNGRYLSAYGHNSALLVSEGDHVDGGQQIAELGNNAAGAPMLHFEIRLEGKAVDPQPLLPGR